MELKKNMKLNLKCSKESNVYILIISIKTVRVIRI